jgi:tetratricopeptide (TPR) repeat protein
MPLRLAFPHATLESVPNQIIVSLLFATVSCLTHPGHAQLRSEGVTLNVRVTERKGEIPLERARVEVVRFPSSVADTGYTDSSGRVEFTLYDPGSYALRASKSGFLDAEVRIDINARDRIAYAAISMELQSQASGSAGGKVSARMLSLPTAATDNFQKGMESLQKKNPRQSLEYFQKAIAAAPDYYEAYFLQGTAYVQLNSTRDAESVFRKAIELKPDFISPYYPLAMVLFGQKRYEEEERLLQQAMKQNADGWQWPFELARCAALRGQWDKALDYGHVASGKPNAPSKVHLLMGDLYSNSGHIPEAIAEFEQFVKADPQSPYIPKVEKALASLRATSRTPTSADSR